MNIQKRRLQSLAGILNEDMDYTYTKVPVFDTPIGNPEMLTESAFAFAKLISKYRSLKNDFKNLINSFIEGLDKEDLYKSSQIVSTLGPKNIVKSLEATSLIENYTLSEESKKSSPFKEGESLWIKILLRLFQLLGLNVHALGLPSIFGWAKISQILVKHEVLAPDTGPGHPAIVVGAALFFSMMLMNAISKITVPRGYDSDHTSIAEIPKYNARTDKRNR